LKIRILEKRKKRPLFPDFRLPTVKEYEEVPHLQNVSQIIAEWLPDCQVYLLDSSKITSPENPGICKIKFRVAMSLIPKKYTEPPYISDLHYGPSNHYSKIIIDKRLKDSPLARTEVMYLGNRFHGNMVVDTSKIFNDLKYCECEISNDSVFIDIADSIPFYHKAISINIIGDEFKISCKSENATFDVGRQALILKSLPIKEGDYISGKFWFSISNSDNLRSFGKQIPWGFDTLDLSSAFKCRLVKGHSRLMKVKVLNVDKK
jgi:hypothetical protein